jgi:hypothetical protein
MQSHKWDHLGRSSKRIHAVVGDQPLEAGQVSRWRQYLNERLHFPFTAFVDYVDEVDEPDLLRELPSIEEDAAVTVLALGQWDGFWGLMVAIEYRGREYDFPLCDLRAGWLSSVRRVLADYQLWWLER